MALCRFHGAAGGDRNVTAHGLGSDPSVPVIFFVFCIPEVNNLRCIGSVNEPWDFIPTARIAEHIQERRYH